MAKQGELYETPTMEMVEIKQEGVICTSMEVQDYFWNEYYEE